MKSSINKNLVLKSLLSVNETRFLCIINIGISPFAEISYEVIKSHRNIDLLPLDCGVKKFPETETQWLVVITDQYGSFQCTGALITYHHMLFPASCLSKVDNVNRINSPPTPFTSIISIKQFIQCFFSLQYKIYLSQDDCWQENNCQSGKSFNVKESLVLLHPQYDPTSNQNDIAIIQLNKHINKIRGEVLKTNINNIINITYICSATCVSSCCE